MRYNGQIRFYVPLRLFIRWFFIFSLSILARMNINLSLCLALRCYSFHRLGIVYVQIPYQTNWADFNNFLFLHRYNLFFARSFALNVCIQRQLALCVLSNIHSISFGYVTVLNERPNHFVIDNRSDGASEMEKMTWKSLLCFVLRC